MYDDWWNQESVWKTVIAQSHAGLVILDREATVLYATPACQRMLGYPSDELIGKPGFNILHPEDRAELQRSFAENVNIAKSSTSFEVRAQHRDGSWRWLECRTTNLSHDESIGVVVVNFADISERKINDELRWLLAAIVQSTEFAIVGADLQGHITSWNMAAEQIYGYTAGEAIGRHVSLLVPPERRNEMMSVLERVFQGQRLRYFETQRRRKDGALIDVGLTVSPLLNGQGNIVGGSAISHDISARKRKETEDEARDTLLHNVLANFPNGTVNVFDRELRYQLVAGQELRERRLTPDHLLGQRISDVLPPAQFAEVEPWLRRGFSGETCSFEQTYDHLSYLVTVTPLVRRDDEIETILVVTQNISERQRVEAERLELLKREQEARRSAQNALQVRDTFLSVASHELKSPLTSLLGTAQMLERRALRDDTMSERNLASIHGIVEHTRRLSNMVNALFDVSRIDSGQFSIEPQLVDMRGIARRVVEDEQAIREDADITCDTPAEPIHVWGDELRLEQVLHNLVQNAFKYSPTGAPVRVRVFCHDERVGISVADRGIGIPPGDIPLLFERFYRASNVAGSRSLSLGIGLYVVQEIVNQHGGQIDVDSRLGAGTTFTVWLPRASARAAEADERS